MGFGKRQIDRTNADAELRGVEASEIETGRDGRTRVIPAAMWDGQAGATLRQLGMRPDDEDNLVPNQHSLEQRLAEGRAKLEAKLMRLNDDIARRTNGGSVRPFFLLPDPCWNGELGHLLMMRLDLCPFDDWNIAFLPEDERTALKLDAPIHPNGNLPAFVKASAEFLAREDANLRAAHAEAMQSEDFAKFHDDREIIRRRVRALAGYFAAQLMKAWHAHNAAPAGRAH
ncbi:hypothetical protein U91I_02720 [alpha proteobacterium U9-1i]|nr:hypothetical protein U91I_02720 [alpha proteobacterium U9-1i]